MTSLPNCAADERQVTERASIKYENWAQITIEKDECQLFAKRNKRKTELMSRRRDLTLNCAADVRLSEKDRAKESTTEMNVNINRRI